jgi:hypothetical protein
MNVFSSNGGVAGLEYDFLHSIMQLCAAAI